MRRALIFIVVILTAVITNPVYAQNTAITNGLNYLTSTQNPDGSWGDGATVTEILPATVSVIETMQVLSETGNQSYNGAVSWLEGQALETIDYIAEKIGVMPGAGTGVDLLISYLDGIYTGGWGGYGGYDANILDTALALKALNAVNYSDLDIISKAIGYIQSEQNTDGGWGFNEGDESNVYMTAVALKVLSSYSSMFDVQSSTNKAASYLTSRQNLDGGFGSSTSTIYETALALEALIGKTTDGTVLGKAVAYLESTQLPNGSWDDDPYETALALRALYFSENIPVPPPAPTTGAVTGKVIDASTGQPLHGVSIILQSDPAVNTATDAYGEFTLSDIPEGSRIIRFSMSGYGPVTVSVDITAGSILDLGTIPLYTNPTTGIRLLTRICAQFEVAQGPQGNVKEQV